MSHQTYRAAHRWLAERVAAVVVVVREARGSVPRDAGTRMIVSKDAIAGTIGGGHLELKAIAHARAMIDASMTVPDLAAPPPPLLHLPLGPALGQCCGGAVTLAFEPLAIALADWPEPEPLFRLQLHGAGHVGRALARQLAGFDVLVDWIDEREDEFPLSLHDGASWPPHIRRVAVDGVEAEVDEGLPGTFYLVMTHDHDLDLKLATAILKRADFGYFGLIGSRTKRNRFIHQLERRGIAAQALSRMVCPIGVDGVSGKEPEIIAAAVLTQMLQAREALSRVGRWAPAQVDLSR